ncbi:hypothetical protein NDU88_003960 [Pleurodeles waltl]|uniref:Uncharacterized protein n=1 Tax=Pleurodeles waltl TaxID=8319 RepID=A0AAV7NR68_PLEWA|nr:hypothetical protein NDU88_003960 [Pleurodeles waltl]
MNPVSKNVMSRLCSVAITLRDISGFAAVSLALRVMIIACSEDHGAGTGSSAASGSRVSDGVAEVGAGVPEVVELAGS